jgi:hypothetical protein
MTRPVQARLGATLLMPIVLIVAACGGATATTAPGEPTPTPPAGATPAATVAPGETPVAGLPSFDLSALSGALPVDSYKATLTQNGVTKYETVVVTKPELAKLITTMDDSGQPDGQFIVIGKKAWSAPNVGDKFVAVPDALASSMLLAFDPSTLLAAYTGIDWGSNASDKGSEQKNGVNAHHLHIDSTTFAGGAIAIPAGAAIDLWVADEGYIVAWEMTGFGELGDTSIEITNIDDPANKVEEPS